VDNVFDNRVLVSYLKQCFNSDVINEQSRGSKKLGPLSVPTTTHYRVGTVKPRHFACYPSVAKSCETCAEYIEKLLQLQQSSWTLLQKAVLNDNCS
jgi:hypothetical protein